MTCGSCQVSGAWKSRQLLRWEEAKTLDRLVARTDAETKALRKELDHVSGIRLITANLGLSCHLINLSIYLSLTKAKGYWLIVNRANSVMVSTCHSKSK